MKATLERLLHAVYLDGVARELLRGARRLAGDLRNRVRPPNADLIAAYLAAHPVRKLHLGCGGHLLDGWLNADRSSASGSVVRFDVTRRFPLDDALFDYVYSEHMIEHLPHSQGGFMLSECHRVLKPGGRVRISTPDLAFVLDLARPDKSPRQADYAAWSMREFVPDAPRGGDAFLINNFVRNWGHEFIYDEGTLRAALADAGFADIVRCKLLQSGYAALSGLENDGRMPPGFLELETMTLEATRP